MHEHNAATLADEFETDLRIAHRRSYRRCGSSEPKPAGDGRRRLRRDEAQKRFPFSQGDLANLKIPM
jgi:CDGSH-type Zn-finger protein